MGKFSDYKVQLKGLPAGTHEIILHPGLKFFNDMENNDIHGADLEVKLTIKFDGERYDLHFDINGEVILLCDRCLDDLHFPIETSYHVMVEYGSSYDEVGDDLLIIPSSENTLNVAYMIYDTIALAIPIKHVHPMGKCNRQMSALLRKHRATPMGEDSELAEDIMEGIDTEQDSAPTDPRWDALKGLGSDQ